MVDGNFDLIFTYLKASLNFVICVICKTVCFLVYVDNYESRLIELILTCASLILDNDDLWALVLVHDLYQKKFVCCGSDMGNSFNSDNEGKCIYEILADYPTKW